MRVFALRPYQPCAHRVYQPATLLPYRHSATLVFRLADGRQSSYAAARGGGEGG
jgi:hypothetical protein